MVFLVSKTKYFGFQGWTISRTCALNLVNRVEWHLKLQTLFGFLNVNAPVKAVFDYLMCFRVSESLVAMNLIILGWVKASEFSEDLARVTLHTALSTVVLR